MTKEEAKAEIRKVFEPAFANYIITALVEGATPSERKTGRWVLCGDEDNWNVNAMYKCSLCFHSDIQAKSQKVPYCWWCGAEMVKEGAENDC